MEVRANTEEIDRVPELINDSLQGTIRNLDELTAYFGMSKSVGLRAKLSACLEILKPRTESDFRNVIAKSSALESEDAFRVLGRALTLYEMKLREGVVLNEIEEREAENIQEVIDKLRSGLLV